MSKPLDDYLMTLLLFETTYTSAMKIKDLETKQETKRKMSVWFKHSRQLRAQLLKDVFKDEDSTFDFEELSCSLYDFFTLAMSSKDMDQTIKVLIEEIKRQDTED